MTTMTDKVLLVELKMFLDNLIRRNIFTSFGPTEREIGRLRKRIEKALYDEQ